MKKDNRAKESSKYLNNKKEIVEKKVNDSEVNENENVEESLKNKKEEVNTVNDFERRKQRSNEAPDNSLKNATVICTCLNVREKPTMTSRIMGVVRKDEKIIVKNTNDGWASIITTTGLNGYCMCEFIQV